MTRRRVSQRDVSRLRTRYRAQAMCGGVNGKGCHWLPFAAGDDREVRRQAREHAANLPGHEVSVTVADVTCYHLPDWLVAELKAATAATGVDATAVNPEESEED